MWLDLKILFKTFFKVLSNADNENKGATVVSNTADDVKKETCKENQVTDDVVVAQAEIKEN